MSDLMSQWFETTTEVDKVSIEEFDKYVEEYLAAKKVADEIEETLTAQNKKVMAMGGKLMSYLDLLGKTKHVVSSGSITKVETKSWNPPEGEGKEDLIMMLKEKGEYDSVVSFNSRKFSTWYDAEKEANPDFEIQGVEQKVTKYIRFNKAK
jgi:hypothetical protein